MNPIQHTRVADQALDRELRALVEAVNLLQKRLGDAGSSFPADAEAATLQAVTVRNNLYSIAIKTKDGMIYSLPGLFVKTASIPSIAENNQILVADANGIFSPEDP